MRRKLTVAVIALCLSAGTAAVAVNLGEVLLKTVATGVIVNAVAKPADKAINTLTANQKLPIGVGTKVVPVLSVGEKGYVGMAQVAGSATLVGQTKSVVQLETAFADKQYRIKVLMPMDDVNPIGVNRVRGLGVTALLDMALSGNAYRLPPSVGWNATDVLKAGVIGYAVSQYGPQLNTFINSVFKNEGGLPTGETKVVPYLSFGTKAYIGMMQVAGPAAQVRQVKAVWQLEQLFDSGRVRLRALVPTNSINPLQLKRVKGVGCTAVIDAMVLRAKDEPKHPDHYTYFRSAPLFVGANEDPHYRRPPGWDRGEKVGWVKHGNPYLPPGQAKKQGPPVIILEGDRERERHRERERRGQDDEDDRGNSGRGHGKGHGR
jgi:hypothetical protein